MFIEGTGDGQSQTFLRLERRPRIAIQDEIEVKQPFPLCSWLFRQGLGRHCRGDSGKGAEVAPHPGKELGALGEALCREGDGDHPARSPRPTCRSRMGQGGAATRLGGGGAGRTQWPRPPSAQSMTFQRPAPRLGRAAPPQPTRHRRVVAGQTGPRPPEGAARPAGLTCPRAGPAPPPQGLPGSPPRGLRPSGPAPSPSSPAPPLTGSRGGEGSRCSGLGGGWGGC